MIRSMDPRATREDDHRYKKSPTISRQASLFVLAPRPGLEPGTCGLTVRDAFARKAAWVLGSRKNGGEYFFEFYHRLAPEIRFRCRYFPQFRTVPGAKKAVSFAAICFSWNFPTMVHVRGLLRSGGPFLFAYGNSVKSSGLAIFPLMTSYDTSFPTRGGLPTRCRQIGVTMRSASWEPLWFSPLRTKRNSSILRATSLPR